MKSALLSKIAMCVCPPAIIATSAVTVPPIKRAVHRATAPHHAVATGPVRPRRAFTAAYDCAPTTDAPVERVTNAAPLPPLGEFGTAGPDVADFGPVAFGQPGVFFPLVPVVPIVPVTNVTPPSAVPEASTWVMTIGGFGAVGAALRRRATPATPRPAAGDA